MQLSGGGLLGGGRQCTLQGMRIVKENITQYSMTTVKMKYNFSRNAEPWVNSDIQITVK